jgi:hypothetical protein
MLMMITTASVIPTVTVRSHGHHRRSRRRGVLHSIYAQWMICVANSIADACPDFEASLYNVHRNDEHRTLHISEFLAEPKQTSVWREFASNKLNHILDKTALFQCNRCGEFSANARKGGFSINDQYGLYLECKSQPDVFCVDGQSSASTHMRSQIGCGKWGLEVCAALRLARVFRDGDDHSFGARHARPTLGMDGWQALV